MFPWPNRNPTGCVAEEARPPRIGAEFSVENGVFVQRRGKEVMDRGLSLPTPKSKGPKGNPRRQERLSQWHQEGEHLCLVFSPVLRSGLLGPPKSLERGDCPRGAEGQSAVTAPLTPTGLIRTASNSKNRVLPAATGGSGGRGESINGSD